MESDRPAQGVQAEEIVRTETVGGSTVYILNTAYRGRTPEQLRQEKERLLREAREIAWGILRRRARADVQEPAVGEVGEPS